MTDRSTRRRGGGLPRNSAEDTTVVTADPRDGQPAYEPVDGGDADEHRHDGGPAHTHTDPPHWHDGDQAVPLHDYPAADDAALYGTDPNPDNPAPYERPQLDGPHPIVTPATEGADPTPEEVDALLDTPEADHDDGAALSEDEEQRFVAQVRKLSPEGRAITKASLQRVIGNIDSSTPTQPPAPLGPPPVSVAGRLGADLGGLEVVKATYRAMFPGAPDAVAEEWALTMGVSDVVGRMLGYHRQGRFADPSLVADLCAMVRQVEAGTTTREPSP